MHQKQRTFCFRAALGAALTLYTFGAQASETITYTYDALGRLVATSTSGTVNNGVTVATQYDPADNRTTYQVEGAKAKVVVVPLNGFTVIPISD